ncbi:hypothetical protein DC498_04730 [Terrimonas sp.]|uniref:ATP-binding protein n=1 Tax=Terrimonas sp. TaxID=1914338 RepID=UPI000D50B4DC|nr:ATP-binding protein [Terrimonas sp.]PVD53185.1 hypothetical protein DC498_04730 [Terrimonas sp.]
MKYTIVILLLFLFCISASFGQHAGTEHAVVRLGNNITSLEKSPWKFHPGDDIEWADPFFNDEGWDTARINFGEEQLPKSWTGFGWFRVWLKKADTSLTNTWGIYLNHDGASEVYFDGRRIMSLGKLGKSKKESVAERNPYLTIPLAITDTLPHLLAIRYCNYHHYYPDFVGFQAWISDLHTMNQKQKSDQRTMDQLLMSVGAACILILLHLLLFIFYPRQKINLYYVLFVAVVAIGLYARYQTIVAAHPAMQIFYTRVFMAFVTLHLSFGVLLLYYAGYGYIPRKKTIIMLLASVPVAIWSVINWHYAWYSPFWTQFQKWHQNIFVLIFFTDAILMLLRVIRKGNKKLWLLVVGIILFLLLGIFIGSNQLGWFTLKQVLVLFGWGNLLMPVAFSIYLAMDIASTNRKLADQLKENERLSSENLAKEQEKNKLISEQAEQLERTVLERTAQVREQAERLKEMDAAKSRFFVNLTHEFKTPLTLIINPAKELLKQPDAEAARQYAGFILQNSERLLQLINQLLDLSRLESGQMDIKYQNIDIIKWLQVHVQQFGSLADYRSVQLGIINNIPSLLIKTDIDKLEKIVQNLISNAIKFSNANGRVDVLFEKKDDAYIELTVKDNGIGIAKEKLPYIFDRFYQVEASDTRTREGAGIGLALVKELAELLGGSISVSSTENAGTTFSLKLPYIPAEKNSIEGAAGINEIISKDHIALLSKVREEAIQHADTVLIVEDNEQLRQFMEISLKESYTILTAMNGADGIEKAIAHIPNLVITDLMMPVKNGYELCDTLKKDERTSHIPVIMLTAKTDQDSRIHGLETGADAYLPKPFDKRELLAQISNLIQTRNRLRDKYSKNNNWLSGNIELPSIEQAFLNRVKDAINNNIDDIQFGAEQLGREVGLSRTQLHRKLKDIIDQSPGELIRTIRMQKAHELLQKNVATVAEAGYMVGYGNPANFSTSFTKHFGYPPSEVGKASKR